MKQNCPSENIWLFCYALPLIFIVIHVPANSLHLLTLNSSSAISAD